MTVTVKSPADCTDEEILAFAEIVLTGGEVDRDGLCQRIRSARLLGFAYEDGQIVSVAAIKQPSPIHAEHVFASSSSKMNREDYPFEYGWAVTMESHRRRGLAVKLLETLLANCEVDSIWATTRVKNAAIHRILTKDGFQQIGKAFPGRKEKLVLWIRHGRTQESDTI